MTRDDVLFECGQMVGAVEDYPFGDEVAVVKIGGKMFALVPLDGDPCSINLKCDPALAVELGDRYPSIRPGYHMNKRHWNTIELDGSVTSADLRELIEHSYNLVVSGLPRERRNQLTAGS